MDFYSKLEYNQIIQIIQRYCKTYIGKKMSSNMKPSFSYDKVNLMLLETIEAVSLLYKKGTPPLTKLAEMEVYLKTLESNQILSTKALLDLAHLLEISRELKEYFKEDFLSVNSHKESINSSTLKSSNDNIGLNKDSSTLEKYFSELYANSNIEKEIFNKILDENTISDNASPKLSSLRKTRKDLEQSVKDKLSSFIHSSTYAKYLMEPVITIRNNRYVIPVKQEYRSEVQGFVHDISSSGSTIYIEPTSIFEANNQIASLKIEEDIEIEKILQILSSLFYEIVPELNHNLYIIGTLDLLFAKAGYAKNTNGVMPILNTEKKINLIKAKHPLIDSSTVVPIDISLGENYTSLIITGPNTGGKTVALKTTGLLLLMAYSGIPIPCNEKSSICVLDNIFVDIGDEQNIQESLSTFSSHMLHIVKIVEQVTPNSLILLDELGSGTDPVEGASLAISILEHFAEIGALVACTTHYQELKEFALVTDGFENASFEFDVENLKPTYHLLIGIPGKSNAFEISKRLGLDSSIIERANSFIKQDHASIEELLKNIYDDKLTIEKQKEETEKNLNQIEQLRKSLEQDQSELIEKQNKMIDDAKAEARDILLSAKEEASEIIKELNAEKIDSKHANQLRNKLNDSIKDLNQTVSISQQLIEHFKGTSSNSSSVKNDIKSNSSFKSGKVSVTQDSKAKFISPEINVIGQTVDDAVFVIDKYLDNCYMSGMSPVRIVHGKGTGKLREGIHKYLKRNSHVKSFRIGTFGEGEMGVTVVELK